jgi:hypothetical protein
MKKLTLLFGIIALLNACSSSSSNSSSSSDADSTDIQQELPVKKDDVTKTGILSLNDAFDSFLQSSEYHGDFDYKTFSERDGINTRLKNLEKSNDFFKFLFTAPLGREDTVTFQLMKKNTDNNLYLFQCIGHTESPRNFYNEIYLAKRNINSGKWELLPLSKEKIAGKKSTYNPNYFTYYNPDNKTITDFYSKEDPSTAFGAVKGNLKTQFKWSDEQKCFVNKNIESNENSWPNPVLVKGNIQNITGEHANYIACQINHNYYHDEGKYKDTKYLTYQYQIPASQNWTELNPKFEKEVINNKDTNIQFMIKYSSKNNYDFIIDYEIIGKSPVIATFESFEASDFNYYGFKSRLGYKYYFNDIADYTYTFENDNGDGPNPKYTGKKFKIYFHVEEVENNVDGGMFDSFIIDKIEAIGN